MRSSKGLVNVAWVVLHRNRHIGASERRQLIPHVRFRVPFLGPESQLKSGFACAGLLCIYIYIYILDYLFIYLVISLFIFLYIYSR